MNHPSSGTHKHGVLGGKKPQASKTDSTFYDPRFLFGSFSVSATLFKTLLLVLCLASTLAFLMNGRSSNQSSDAKYEPARLPRHSDSPRTLTRTGKAKEPATKSKANPSAVHEPDQVTRARVLAMLDTLPMTFEANRGPLDAPIEFVARTHDYNLYLEQSKVLLSFPPIDAEACETDERRTAQEQEEVREQGTVNC